MNCSIETQQATGDTTRRGAKPGRALLPKVISILVSISLALVAVESITRILVVSSQPPMTGSLTLDGKWQVATMPAAEKAAIFMTGQSYGSYGLNPDLAHVLLAQKGYRADVRNLGCVNGATIGEQVFLMESAIKAGCRPVAVICALSPLAFNLNTHEIPAFSKSFLMSSVGVRQINVSRTPVEAIDHWMEENFYIVRYRSWLRQLLTHSLDAVLDPDHEIQSIRRTAHRPDICSINGWTPSYAVHEPADVPVNNQYKSGVYGASRQVRRKGEITFDCIRPIEDFCSSRNIPLILVWLPELPFTNEYYRTAFGLTQSDFAEAMAQLEKKHSIWFLDMHDGDKDPLHFALNDHLNAAGSCLATERLVKTMTESPMSQLLEPAKKESAR